MLAEFDRRIVTGMGRLGSSIGFFFLGRGMAVHLFKGRAIGFKVLFSKSVLYSIM
jgi:hypothetical protein